MKKINDLKSQRLDIITKMETIVSGETLNEEQRSEWTGLDTQVKSIDDEIAILERQDALNKITKNMENTTQPLEIEQRSLAVQFRDWLKESVENGGKSPAFRFSPWLATSDTAIINKTVAPTIDILTSPAEAWLRQLGVTFYTGLTGNLVLPSMAEETASFIAEGTCDGDASMGTSSLTLAARRVSNYQDVTLELLAQTNPGIYAGILQNLNNGIWNAVTNDVFDTLETDAATQIKVTGTTATYQDILNMEASIGGLNIGSGAYVTTPTGKAFFKGLDVGSDGIKYAWNGNEMNGYPAFGAPAANANRVYFGDWSKQAVAQWGDLSVLVDPYTMSTCGKVRLVVTGLFDTGTINKRGFAILDASLS